MTSKIINPDEAYVWIWLPGEVDPVVAGRLMRDADRFTFIYGSSYRGNPAAIPIYTPELPLREGLIKPAPGMMMPSCIRDAAPDAWGRRIINRLTSQRPAGGEPPQINELTYLLISGSDRIGALDFQQSATEYIPRLAPQANLEDLLEAAERIQNGLPLSPALDDAINHGTSIGGARPKALIDDEGKKYIAKFPATPDLYNMVKAEFMAMRLGMKAGLNVAHVDLAFAGGKDVLLIERFDRKHIDGGWTRRAMVSALTMLGLDEMMPHYASYEDLAETIRHRFTDPKATLKELYGRLCFNILCGNTDDHARNHAAFWDGKMLTLTPAYDLCPQGRTGGEAAQAMLIHGQTRLSTLANCLTAAPAFLLAEPEAVSIIGGQITAIADNWEAVCDEAALSLADRRLFAGRQFLNAFCGYGLQGTHAALRAAFENARAQIISAHEQLIFGF